MTSAASSMVMVEQLIAVAVCLQATELLVLNRTWMRGEIWDWAIIRDDFQQLPRPLRWLFDRLMPGPVFRLLVTAQLVSGIAMLVAPDVRWAAAMLSIATLTSLRWRGAFNGGCDSMTLLVLAAVTVCRAYPQREDIALGAILYIALQSTLSYFVAGVAKIRASNWRRGQALPVLCKAYGAPHRFDTVLAHRHVGLLAAWVVMTFECAFPLALLAPNVCLAFIGMALVFHLANVYILGLNRFVFAWAATFPALYYVSGYSGL